MADKNKTYEQVVREIFSDPMYKSIRPEKKKEAPKPVDDYRFGFNLEEDIKYLIDKNSKLAPTSPFKTRRLLYEGGNINQYKVEGGKFYQSPYGDKPKWKRIKREEYYGKLGKDTKEHVDKIKEYMEELKTQKTLPLQKMVKSPLEQYMGAQGMNLNGALVFPMELGNHTMTMNRPDLQPLDIISTKNGKVQDIAKYATPGSGNYTLYGDHIIEVPAGMAKDIKPGDKINFKNESTA